MVRKLITFNCNHNRQFKIKVLKKCKLIVTPVNHSQPILYDVQQACPSISISHKKVQENGQN